MNYNEQLQQPEWIDKRNHILRIREFACERCGDKNGIFNVHHKYYDLSKKAWEYPDEALECLCEHCHELEHISSCCKTPLFSLLYDPDARAKILRPAYPLYCHICGTPLIPGA